jgi:hypothetical protein
MTTEVKKTITVWVVEVGGLGQTRPRVQKYEVDELRKDSFTVRGSRRPQVVRLCAGRHFFTDKDHMLEFCREFLDGVKKHHEGLIRRICEDLAAPEYNVQAIPHGSALGHKK